MLLGQYETAIAHEEKAVSARMYYGLLHGFLAYAYGKSGQKAKALKVID